MAEASPRPVLGVPPVVGSVPPVAGMPPLEEISRQQSPRDRDIAAARLRSILTSAMDASRISAAAASETSPTRSNVRLPSTVYAPPDRHLPNPASRSMPLPPWNKLPEMSLTTTGPPLSHSATGLPAYHPNSSPTTDISNSATEPRLLGRLAPLVTPRRPNISYSPRLEPIQSFLPGSQSNSPLLSTFTGGAGSGPRKPSSMYGNAK